MSRSGVRDHLLRFRQLPNTITELLQALESYSSHLEASFLQINLPPVSADGTIPPTFDLSPSYISSVDSEFTRVYEEYTKRTVTVQQIAEEIVKLWAELGTPQAQIDEAIAKVPHSPVSARLCGISGSHSAMQQLCHHTLDLCPAIPVSGLVGYQNMAGQVKQSQTEAAPKFCDALSGKYPHVLY